MKAEYYFKREVEHILAALMPANRLACEVSLATGLRIGDVLRMKTEALAQRMTVQEEKTGKNRRVYLTNDLYTRLLRQAGRLYVFPHRLDGKKHRTRQAVYKDLRRVRDLMRLKVNLSPHSMRKVYAVNEFHKDGDLKRVQKLLNHSSEAVTMIYALADEQLKRRGGKRRETER
jgi:integrase